MSWCRHEPSGGKMLMRNYSYSEDAAGGAILGVGILLKDPSMCWLQGPRLWTITSILLLPTMSMTYTSLFLPLQPLLRSPVPSVPSIGKILNCIWEVLKHKDKLAFSLVWLICTYVDVLCGYCTIPVIQFEIHSLLSHRMVLFFTAVKEKFHT